MLHLTPQKSGSVCELYFFAEEGLADAFRKFKWREKGKIIVDINGNAVKCGICGDAITNDNLSAFFPGSVGVACSKPECFVVALHKSKH